MAVGTQGTLLSTETVPGSGTFDLPIGEVVSWDGPTSSKPEIDVTHLQSTSKEFIAGLPDRGSISFAMNFTIPEDAGQAALRTNFETTNAPDLNFEIQITDGVGTRTAAFAGYVSEFPSTGETDSKVDQNASIRINGDVTWTAA